MSSRGMAAGFNDTMHITLSVVFSLLVVAMMVLSAVAYPGWFRLYALATMVVVVGFGMASSLAMRGIEQNDTPWAGGFERINAYAYFAWLVVLTVMVIRHELGSSQTRSELGGFPSRGADRRVTAASAQLSLCLSGPLRSPNSRLYGSRSTRWPAANPSRSAPCRTGCPAGAYNLGSPSEDLATTYKPLNSRDGRIRTGGLLLPKQAR